MENQRETLPVDALFVGGGPACLAGAIHLSRLCAWLGEVAEAEGVNVFCGFPGKEVLFSGGAVTGVRTGDRGLDAKGEKKGSFEPGADIQAAVTVFGEGSRGSLLSQVDEKLGLFSGPGQCFEAGIKQVLQIPPDSPLAAQLGTVVHTLGPAHNGAFCGGFLYPMAGGRAAAGLVAPLSPGRDIDLHQAFCAFMTHPYIRKLTGEARPVEHGARTLCAGGPYTMPRLCVDGAVFVGDSASMLDPRRLKGVHGALVSGMLAARAVFCALAAQDLSAKALSLYQRELFASPLFADLWRARNFHQAVSRPGFSRWLHIAAQEISLGRGFFDPLPRHKPAKKARKPGFLVFGSEKNQFYLAKNQGSSYLSREDGVFLSGTRHEEDQPCHIILRDPDLCTGPCREQYANPCTRFCPAGVYEVVESSPHGPRLKLNPSNCLHCKTCEVMDPFGNILWTCPEGGGGPHYRFA
ncbi:MAG: electron transfer flavoprotein-ubiquinone oxidoreductase [Deltaproteobacteria bacterium]|nr:electron transfer flavoprotein-ubiquinone oxidoreductase [Deltaproteobacteria bacterium]